MLSTNYIHNFYTVINWHDNKLFGKVSSVRNWCLALDFPAWNWIRILDLRGAYACLQRGVPHQLLRVHALGHMQTIKESLIANNPDSADHLHEGMNLGIGKSPLPSCCPFQLFLTSLSHGALVGRERSIQRGGGVGGKSHNQVWKKGND